MEHIELTLEDLVERVGIPARTIRFYITEGLLTGPEGRGKAATYGEDHLLRLRLIRLLSERHMPLAEIRALVAPLSVEEVRSLLAEQEQQQANIQQTQSQKISPKDYIGALLKQAQQVKERQTSYQPQAPAPIPPAAPVAPKPVVPSAPPLSEPTRARRAVTEEQMAKVKETTDQQEAWTRWELAPGVELQVKTNIIEHYRDLVTETIKRFQQTPSPQDKP